MKKMLFLLLLLLSICSVGLAADNTQDFYKLEMQRLMRKVRTEARIKNPSFGILVNGGTNIYYPPAYASNNNANAENAIALVDGILIESFNFGFNYQNGAKTPVEVKKYFLKTIELAKKNKVALFNIDYCRSSRQQNTAMRLSRKEGFVNYAATRGLDELPLVALNDKNVRKLQACENFCFLLNPHKFASKEIYLASLRKSSYDLLIIDGYFGDSFFTAADIAGLRVKPNGKRRLVYCYMSLGEAENYRWYWKQAYHNERPEWLDEPNENWQGSYKVKYWMQPWHDIIYNARDSYLSKIVDAGFDGAFLDVIDAFEYFQAK